MKMLLTSNGLCNQTIVNALRDLLGQDFSQSRCVFIPTAANAELGDKGWLATDLSNVNNCRFERLGIVDLAAAYSLGQQHYLTPINDADVIIVGGGNDFYLSC